MNMLKQDYPYAITMWDYSWLERRWPGAGFENWDVALDELVERGYDAVRIDAYPHFIWDDPTKEWEIIPVRNQQDFGSPARTRIQVQPNLNTFIKKCGEHNVKVALSAWWAIDLDNTVKKIKTPMDLAMAWKATLDSIADEGLLEHILYVDPSNEFPLGAWTPFLADDVKRKRDSDEIQRWMKESLDELRKHYPDILYTFSEIPKEDLEGCEEEYMDFFDPHIWMAGGEFYQKINYNYEKFDPIGYDRIALYAEDLYKSDKDYWINILNNRIDSAITQSENTKKLLVTTESWAVIQYKDWPLLDWAWVKELCEIGTKRAAESGKWAAICTSNFCAPQFRGMWRDIEWHKRLTNIIKSSKIKHY